MSKDQEAEMSCGCPITEYLFAAAKSRPAEEKGRIGKWQAPWLSHGGFLSSSYFWFVWHLCPICIKMVKKDGYGGY